MSAKPFPQAVRSGIMPRPMKSVTTYTLLAAAVFIALGGGGCDMPVIYQPWTGGKFGADISPRAKWKVSGTLANAQAITDGDLLTAAKGAYRNRNDELIIDLGRHCVFELIIIDHGESQDGYVRRVGIATSIAGQIYTDRYQAPGTRRVTHILLPQPVGARYLRLRVLTPGRLPWSVAEVFVQ